jgi:integrase/recombinase XerD
LEFEIPNPMESILAPRFKINPVEPFKQDEVETMLKVCLYSREVHPGNRKNFIMRLANGTRDQAILLVLLDTGVRASEFCSLRIEDVDLKTGRVLIKHGIVGGAKGGKGRTVFLGKATRRSIMRYLAKRENADWPDAYLFVSKADRPFNPNSLRQLIKSIAERANVRNTYPHRFRHTFAITYLRAGGDLFTLQALLGHTTLDMVRRYARIAEIDIEQAHRKASPVDNWRL